MLKTLWVIRVSMTVRERVSCRVRFTFLGHCPAESLYAGLSSMASAVFEGTSLVNMFVKDCWVNGVRRLIISERGDEEEFFELRTEWSDRNVLYLHRSYSDLGRLFKRLLECFPKDRRDLSKSALLEGWYLQTSPH